MNNMKMNEVSKEESKGLSRMIGKFCMKTGEVATGKCVPGWPYEPKVPEILLKANR